MKELVDYVLKHTERGACQCGKCFDAPENPKELQPNGHTADLVFFKVSAKDADAAKLKKMVHDNKQGDYCNVDLFDGKEHSYLELGGWIGDQGIAMQLMGLGSILGLWRLLTPRTIFGRLITDEQAMQMAGRGLVAIQVQP